MKAYSNHTITATMATWLRWGAGTLLTLAALIVGLLMFWRINERATLPISASDSFVRHAAGMIESCRACRDEWIAAHTVQPVVAVPAQRPQTIAVLPVSRADTLIASCRACRDERIAAQAVQLAITVPAQRPPTSSAPAISHVTGSITSCRVCRDEWLAARSPIIPTGGGAFEQPEEYFRTSGPR